MDHRHLSLVIALVAEQKKLGVGDYRFAQLLGISQPYWWRLRHGQRSAGDDLVRHAVLSFPHLALELAERAARA